MVAEIVVDQRRAGRVRAGADVPRAARRLSMFEKVLIANRGEIALRVARACREIGHQDGRRVLHRRRRLAPSCASPTRPSRSARRPPSRSYIHIPSVIGAALKTGADAIHPGYGFLSEDPYFAEICADHDITFIGPRPEVMEKVGDKAIARRLMRDAGLPLLPGHDRAGGDDPGRQRRRRRDRLPADHQGRRRRRRARHERRARAARTWSGSTRPRARRRRPCSRTPRSTWSATWRRRATPRSSWSATTTATASTSSSATARSSAATRS